MKDDDYWWSARQLNNVYIPPGSLQRPLEFGHFENFSPFGQFTVEGKSRIYREVSPYYIRLIEHYRERLKMQR